MARTRQITEVFYHDRQLPRMSKERRQRYREIMEMRKMGLTMQAIGDKLGISRERVRQLINKGGKTKKRKFFLSVYRAEWLSSKAGGKDG